MATILVVEDDKSTRLLTAARLRGNYNVVTAEDGEQALDVFYHEHIDLIVADVMMPRMDGYEMVRTLRDYGADVPVILLTAKTAFEDKKEGFSSGTDDYMTKPVNYEELIWRIDSLLRRAKINSDRQITIGKTVIDQDNYTVSRTLPSGEKEEVQLAKKEFDLLFKLLSYPGQIFTKEQLLEDVWGMDTESEDSTVKTHISRLRARFEDWGDFRIATIRGLGYKAEY